MDSILKIPGNGEPNVLVVFSVRNTLPGKFTYWKVTHSVPATKIFINDYSTRWYIDGTPDFPDHEAFIIHLKQLIAANLGSGGQLWMMGSSMGAYAALKYGSMFEADRILALGPESELCIPLGKSVASIKDRKAGDGPIFDLRYKSPKDVSVIYGNSDIVDVYSASKLKKYNPEFNVISLINKPHSVAGEIAKTIDMAPLIERFFVGGKLDGLGEFEKGVEFSYEESAELKMFNEDLHVRKTVRRESKKTLENALVRSPKWGMANYMYGALLEEYKFEDAALTYFRNAVEISPELGRARMRMSEILFTRRRFKDAIRELELVPEPKINYQWASLLSRSYEKLGELSRAASVWETFLKRPRNSAQSSQAKAHMAALLDALKRKLGG